MRLRLRLFIYIGAVFLFITTTSFFLEEYLINQDLREGRNDLVAKINKFNEQRLEQLRTYITDYLIDYRTKINALLILVRDYPAVRLNFEPVDGSYIKQTWLDSSTLITNNKWIDIVQNIKNGDIASSILLDNQCMPQLELYEVIPDLKIGFLPSTSKAVVAVPWSMEEFFPHSRSIRDVPGQDTDDFYVLFDPAVLMNVDIEKIRLEGLNLSINPLYPFLKWIEVPEQTSLLTGFINHLEEVQIQLKNHPEILELQLQTKESFLQPPLRGIEGDDHLNKLIDRYEQIGLLWGYAALIASGPFGHSPFDAYAPLGLLRAHKGAHLGKMLLREKVFFKEVITESIQSADMNTLFQDVLRVILFKDEKDRCCFGNTITFTEYGKRSDLTVGIDADNIFKQLSLVTSKDLLFISDYRLISVFNSSGKKEDNIMLTQEEVGHLLDKPYGTISYKGQNYIFLHIIPFEDQDFHFCVLSPEKKEFFLVDRLNQDLKWLAGKITWQMGSAAVGAFVILLFLLDRMARRITKPIVALVKATEEVKEGHFEEAFSLKPTATSQDEVRILYEAFYDMVNGLKEKEKVRGILNKVVSTDIANEILRHELYLGGEEKEVTMFFSDIRNFTAITENMLPKDVIDILNTCMTKISKVIDGHHGVIDKFVGDEVMALFGAPIARAQSTADAVFCAIEVMRVLHTWNQEREQQHEQKIEMGIGIHKGKVFAGNMGAQNRLNYTVLGANVNLAARLCSEAKSNEILISKEVYEEVRVYDSIEVEVVSPLILKGFSHKIEAYRVLGYNKKP